MPNSNFHKVLFLLAAVSLVSAQCSSKGNNRKQSEPVSETVEAEQANAKPNMPLKLYAIDLKKDVSKETIRLDIEEVKYILLETTDKILLDRNASIVFYSEESIVIINRQRGDIFVFNPEGKCTSFFNHRGGGPEEYPDITNIMVDEKAKEIFVAPIGGNIIFVYAFDGKFRRKLTKPFSAWLGSIYNVNDTLLLTSVEMPKESTKTDPPPMQYLLLSKKTGEIVRPLEPGFTKRAVFDKDPGSFTTGTNIPIIMKSGDDIYISELSSDTIYHLGKDGKTTPFIVRKPSVFATDPQLFLQVWYKNGTILTLAKTTNELISNDQGRSTFKIDPLILDLETGETGGRIKYHSDNEDGDNIMVMSQVGADAPANVSLGFANASHLIESLENGNVKSEALKKIASLLKEDDNPVLVIFKYK